MVLEDTDLQCKHDVTTNCRHLQNISVSSPTSSPCYSSWLLCTLLSPKLEDRFQFSRPTSLVTILFQLQVLDQSLLFIFRKRVEHEDRFITNVILHILKTYQKTPNRYAHHHYGFWLDRTFIGWVNFLPAKITKRAIQKPNKVAFTPSSIKPVCNFHENVLSEYLSKS